ncbi:MAG: BrnA antitoxin family protein [Azoarcus sp.]|jgi:uncharacterized protein (DUF4415 family)|nr:BrnA antitoxin family protein [Azoarcus sp.]
MSLLKPEPALRTQSANSAVMLAGLIDGHAWRETPQQEHIMLCLDTDVLDALQATGEDWESLFNDTLRQWLKTNLPVL